MQAEIKSFTDQHLNRISQLISKTNQFNLTTERFNIHAVKNLMQTHLEPVSDSISEHQHNDLNLSDITPVESDKFRVQLASFSSKANANKYLNKLSNSNYALSIMPIGAYYIVYASAQTLSQAKEQQKYFKDTYQISAVRIEIEKNGNQK